MAGDLIELVEYPTKGTGVRALSNFKAGTIMGEYVGEVLPINRACTDDIYSLAQSGLLSISGTGIPTPGPLAHTTSAHLGNWTRYINHHCDPNCYFESIMIGDRVTTIVKACRDISILSSYFVYT
jgi:SET domain-containing protein